MAVKTLMITFLALCYCENSKGPDKLPRLFHVSFLGDISPHSHSFNPRHIRILGDLNCSFAFAFVMLIAHNSFACKARYIHVECLDALCVKWTLDIFINCNLRIF